MSLVKKGSKCVAKKLVAVGIEAAREGEMREVE